jgi:signal transduction histidine kinase
MKLWLKISLITVIIIALASVFCTVDMAVRSGRSHLDLAVQYTLADRQTRVSSWSTLMESMMEHGMTGEYSTSAERSLARYLIDKFASENTILISGDDFIYNSTQFNPKEFLAADSDAGQYVIRDAYNKSLLIVGSTLNIGETIYDFYIIKDITSVYDDIKTLSYQFALITLVVVLIAGAIVISAVRFVLRPISTLNKNAGLIAKGIYSNRIQVKRNDEVGELAKSFNHMAAAIEAHVDELRSEAQRRTMFMSALTHELKTPMTSISGNAQTLLATKLDEDERADALIRINDECTRIERLSQKLMQLIVLQQKDSIPLKKQNMDIFLESVRASCQEQLNRRGVTLAISNNMDSLVMDKDLLSSLLINLIDNAGKASDKGGTIELLAQGNIISIKDHGKGIPSDELNKITQPFYMADKSRSKAAGGIGLGLTIAEQIAQLHGAKLLFESAVGVGTTVKVVCENG